MLDLDDIRSVTAKARAARGPGRTWFPLINGADRNLRWFIAHVRGHYDAVLGGVGEGLRTPQS